MRTSERAGLALLFFWLLIFLCNVAVWGVLGYVALHFIHKLW